MSKLEKLLNGVTQYPAAGKPCMVRVWSPQKRAEVTYYLGHVWTGDREGKYLRPRETVQEANLDAINAIIAIKKG